MRSISGPAAAVIFLAVGTAILLSTAYISDLFGSISFERRIATKLMIGRPQHTGQDVVSLVEGAFTQGAQQATLDVANWGAGRPVWYCNYPQPPSISEVKASLCSQSYVRSQELVEERLAGINYTVIMPNCITINITSPDTYTILAKGRAITGPGVNTAGSAEVNVTSRFWSLYGNMTRWVSDDMGGVFFELCKVASKPCQVRECSCDHRAIEASVDSVSNVLSVKESEVQAALDNSLQKLQSQLGDGVSCEIRPNIVIDNSPTTQTRETVGCNCDTNLPVTCSMALPYLDDPTGTGQLNECNSSTGCFRCLGDKCRSVLPAYGCEAREIRLDIATIGPPYLAELASDLGHFDAALPELVPSAFKDNVLIFEGKFEPYLGEKFSNFANHRAIIMDAASFEAFREKTGNKKETYTSKGEYSDYFLVGSGVVIKADPGKWKGLGGSDRKLLAAHYWDLIASQLYEKVGNNCTSLLPGALAAVITQYPANGTELLASMSRTVYLYGTVSCEDHTYMVDGKFLTFAFDFWVSLEKSCPLPPSCEGISTNCQSALTSPVPSFGPSCPSCLKSVEVQGVKIRRTEDGSVKCKHFSGPQMICEFEYGDTSVLSSIPKAKRIFSVPCTCSLNNIPTDCQAVVWGNNTAMRPEVRCPVAFPEGVIFPTTSEVPVCGTIADRFGFNVTGTVCDIPCFDKDGSLVCAACTPNFGAPCGCGSCAFGLSGVPYAFSGGKRVWMIGEHQVYTDDGKPITFQPTVDNIIVSQSCTSLLPSYSCGGVLHLDTAGTELYAGLYGAASDAQAALCLPPRKIWSGTAFIEVCGCADKAEDPSLRSKERRFSDPNYLSSLSKDRGFRECCTDCSLAVMCGTNKGEWCRYDGTSCREWLINSGGNHDTPEWQKFLDCCSDNCIAPCSACTCTDSPGSLFCDLPICGQLWETSCSHLFNDPLHASCIEPHCTMFPDQTCAYTGSSFNTTRQCAAVGCSPASLLPSCGASGICGTCASAKVSDVIQQGSNIKETAVCQYSGQPSLSEACSKEIKRGVQTACLSVVCDYDRGTYQCATNSSCTG